jgi:ATP-dependent DNA helicase RecQ
LRLKIVKETTVCLICTIVSDYLQILNKYWGHAAFRPLQLEIIESVAKGHDTLGLLPTGGGKSVIFQVYAMSVDGMCLVITPLIALMKDQVENLNRRGIKAISLHSGMSAMEMKVALDNAQWGGYKFLYISPERLTSERFAERLRSMKISLIAVDEAHCISQWGYDFRPSYLRIAEMRPMFPGVPVLALTATATPAVASDIQERLRFGKPNLLTMSFARKNLVYMVRVKEDKYGYIVKTIEKAKGSGIVYVRNRRATREIRDLLVNNGISADYYHAGLNSELRNRRQDEWISGKTRVIVATNAFGMGIDKPDVRFVIHADPPDSLEAYFQEAGRAGRDGKKAVAVLLFNNADKLKLKKQVPVAYPEIDYIKRVYESLCNYLQVAVGFGRDQVYDFPYVLFAETYKFQIRQLYHSLKILQRQGYIEFTEEVDTPSRVYFAVSRDELYKFQVANESFDNFVKLLLRSYTGLFTGYVIIDETLLAKRAETTPDVIIEYLKRLRSHKIIDYVPRKRTPYILFTRERIEAKRLTFTKEIYELRKKDFIRRVDAVIYYATSATQCRSQILLSYFGETNSVRCGTCDVCLSRNQLDISKFEFDQMVEGIKQKLTEPVSLAKLLLSLDSNSEKTREVLRWLIDNGEIVSRIDGLLEWKS